MTFADLNAEFNNIIDNQQDIGWPRDGTIATDLDGNELILDADEDTSITADTDDQIDFKINSTDTVVMTQGHITFNGKPLATETITGMNAVRSRTHQHRIAHLEDRVLETQVLSF